MVRLEPDTLAAILMTDGFALTPLSPEQRMLAEMEVRTKGHHASSDDAGACALRQRISSVAGLLEGPAQRRLSELPLLWVDSSLPHAAAINVDEQPAILVCRGLFDFVHFQTTLTSICSLLSLRESVLGDQPKTGCLPSQLMHLAGHVVLADAYVRLRSPSTFATMLGARALAEVELGVSTSLLLLLLHELGHVDLGHTQRTCITHGVSVETVPPPSESHARVQLEMEADAYSIQMITENSRENLLASLISLHNIFHFFQVFGVRPSREYPDVDRRLRAMIQLLPLRPQDRDFAASWLDDYDRRQISIAASPTTPAEMLTRFETTMDAATAYREIEKIRADLAAANIILERAL